MKTIYLDNGATSYPKPECVAKAVNEYIVNIGATINRSVYESAQNAGLVAYTLRERFCRLFNFKYPDHVVLTAGNTMSLNMIIKGYLRAGDHCLVSSLEHNAVMRPLTQLSKSGVSFDRIPCGSDGLIDPEIIPSQIKPNTRLVIIAHASNVSGGVQDIYRIGEILSQYDIPFVVDAAQTAGHFPIDFERAKLSAMTVPGHKGLMGPQGIGAALLSPDFAKKLDPLIAGGTGSVSDSEEIPEYMPDRFEAGTANMPGIYGLEAALAYIESVGVDALREHDTALTKRFLDGLKGCADIRIVGPCDLARRVGVVSIDFIGKDNAEAAYELEVSYGILTRCGMHCAPSAHKTLGTFPQGVVRFSIGYFNTEEDIDDAVKAIKEIAQK